MKPSKVLIPGTHLQGVDLWKYIMAIAVVAIHAAAISTNNVEYPWIIRWFIRLAVPFFFISSGFLIAREVSVVMKKAKANFLIGKAKKILRLYLLWLLIYLPIAVFWLIINHTPTLKIITSLITSALIYGEVPYAWPLWYLYTLLLMLLGMAKTERSKLSRILFISLVLIFYISRILSLTYYENILLTTDFGTTIHKILSSRVFGGGIYFLVGIAVFHLYRKIANIISIVFFITLSIIFQMCNLPSYEIWGGIGIFLFANMIGIEKNKLYLSLRIQSIWIYYLHMYVIFALVYISIRFESELQLWPTFIIVVISSIGLAWLLSQLQNSSKFKFLNILTK